MCSGAVSVVKSVGPSVVVRVGPTGLFVEWVWGLASECAAEFEGDGLDDGVVGFGVDQAA